MSHKPAARRNPRIEALRLLAIAGIAVFHTLQPWLEMAGYGWWDPRPHVLFSLGVVSLLGSYGNHVFFLISGLFLVPRAAEASTEPGYWGDQLRRTGRRALAILASVALYAACALAVSTWVSPIAGVSLHEGGWLVGGLEFIWVYLVLVAACPVMGWVWRRTRHVAVVVGALVACVFAVNAYIAFVSPGEASRGLLEWRKLMSAVTYLVSFLVGGLLPRVSPARARAALACCAGVTLLVEASAAWAGDVALVQALSFKSTSLLSFGLAAASVAVAAAPRPEREPGPAGALALRLAPSILGFYIMQSLFLPLWQPVLTQACQWALDRSGEALLVAGTLLSLVLLALALLVDRVVRVPLLGRLGLA